jgi:EpsD family peptidyl-prolyl cis-trans isomerase
MTYCGVRVRVMGLCAVCAVTAMGCAREQDAAEGTAQVIAHVGAQVATVTELGNEMRNANVPPEVRTKPAIVRQAVSELVLRKYLVQKALGARLDEEPDVLLDVSRAREQVLARAWVARASATAFVSEHEINEFIAAHPEKFQARHMLAIDQIRFALGPGSLEAIEGARDAASLAEVDRRLTALGVAHNRSLGAISGGDLPADLGSALAVRKPDQLFFGRLGSNGLYFTVKSEQVSPLEGAAATAVARELLKEQAAKAQLASFSKAALSEAKYEGEYAKIMSSEHGPAEPPSSPASAAAQTSPAPAPPPADGH